MDHSLSLKRVLLVDDHSMFRWGVAQYIERLPDYELVGEVANGKEALAFLADNTVDLILLDLEMPELDGAGFLTELNKRVAVKPKIIVVSQTTSTMVCKKLQNTGIDGYILKTEGIAEIGKALAALESAEKYFSPLIAQRLWGWMQELDAVEEVSEREYEVAKYIGQGHSTKAIAETLGLTLSTIKTHRSNLMKKIGAKTPVEVAKWFASQES